MSTVDSNLKASGAGQSAPPADPVAAVIHPDPHPYYASLAAERPFYRDDKLKLWVASSAAAVTAVLTSDICRVRPPSEPVPKAIAGSAAGEIFGRLVRMNDGENHCPFKRAIVATLDAVTPARVTQAATERAQFLMQRFSPTRSRGGLNQFMFAIAPETLATLLGVPSDRIEEVAAWVGDYVPVGAGSVAAGQFVDANEIEAGKDSARRLLDFFAALLDRQSDGGTMLGALAQQARQAGGARDAIIANAIGFMPQSYDSTAGLIGNALLALADVPDLRSLMREPEFIRQTILDVLRLDPPTQNTRRVVVRDGVIAGQTLREGDVILVLLPAAGRDPTARQEPPLNFGAGPHACPGAALAPAIAETAVTQLLSAGLALDGLREGLSYRRSAAIRMPVFG
jgi:cytochrome P450